MDVTFQKSVYMIIIRSQRPVLVYAGPFAYLSHTLMLTVITIFKVYFLILLNFIVGNSDCLFLHQPSQCQVLKIIFH